MDNNLIVGAGPAGVMAAETLRKQIPGAEVTLIGDEPEPPYSRMAIPYYLAKDIGEDGTHLRHGAGHYDNNGIAYIKARIARIDPATKTVFMDDGRQANYNKLLLATGASPIRPPIEGLDLPGVHTCWTLEDARNIAQLAQAGTPVVLIGAGFIGSIILEALHKMGVALTVIEMGDRMVPRMMDEVAGNLLRKWCEIKKGIEVFTGTSVTKIASSGGAAAGAASGATGAAAGTLSVTLSNGESLPAGLVVVAAGVRPNMAFLEGSGIETDIGVRVNEYLQTSVPDIYAAGDVAQGRDLLTGQFDVLAIQPVAVEHGRIAALNMAGLPTIHRGSVNMNVLDTIGLISSSFGIWTGVEGGETARSSDEQNYRYIRLEFFEDRLVGAQTVGMTDHIGILRGLIQTGTRLGPWKDKLLKSPERLAEAYVGTANGL